MYTASGAPLRSSFSMLAKKVNGHPFVYLDSGATTLKPDEVIDAITRFYRDEYATVHRAVYTTAGVATELYEESRKKVAAFIGAASSDEIIFTRGTTAALNLVAHSFAERFLQKGDAVIITEMEHHSNIVPWQMVCAAYGAELQVVPFHDSGVLDIEAFKKLLSPRTKLVACAHISNTLGTLNPIQEMIALAHEVGAKVVIDAAQSVAHMPLDVQALDADFVAFSGHKMYGPTGVGVLYGKKALLEEIPPYEGGGDMIETVTFEKTSYAPPPMKFEAGTPLIAGVIGLGAAVDFLQGLGIQNIRAHEEKLYHHLAEELRQIPGLKIIGEAQEKGALATFYVQGVHPLDIATMVDLKGIAIRSGHLCAQPVMRHFGISAAARASLACYNTKEDVDSFVSILKETLIRLR